MGSPPPFHSSSQKTRLNDLLYGIKILTDLSSVLSQCTRLTDRQTDGQTDSFLIAIPRLRSMQRRKHRVKQGVLNPKVNHETQNARTATGRTWNKRVKINKYSILLYFFPFFTRSQVGMLGMHSQKFRCGRRCTHKSRPI